MGRSALDAGECPADYEFGMEGTSQLSLDDLEPSDELCRTRDWRLDQFTSLGFDVLQAVLMADDALVDLAQARRLVAMGCPLDTAFRILF